MNTNFIISKQVAQECAAELLNRNNKEVNIEEFNNIVNFLCKWIMSKGENREVLIQRQASLKRAFLCINIIIPKIDSTLKLIELAESLLNEYKC